MMSNMLLNFSATMSDHAEVMKSFNNKFSEWRSKVFESSTSTENQKQ